jgi:hypothetical protein
MEADANRVRSGLGSRFAAALLAACDGGGPSGVRLRFALDGDGRCSAAIVDIDLQTEDLGLLDRGGVPDCGLDRLLAERGCSAHFERIDEGTFLRARVTGCEFDAGVVLFDCGFREADVSAASDAGSSQCTCASAECDGSPKVCAIDPQTGLDCEDCSSGDDDDGDGLEDCEDPYCRDSEDCTETTTSTTTTVVAPTTTSSTTSTSLDPMICTVTFRLADDVVAGSLQWTTTYTAGSFLGSGAQVECDMLVPDAISAFNDDDAGRLVSGFATLEGLDGPANIAQCTVRTAYQPVSTDFTISDVEAATPDLVLIQPDPSIEVFDIDCNSVVCFSSCPSSTTSMTMPHVSTTLETAAYVELHLESSSAPVGALQVSVDYTAATGEFHGGGTPSFCKNLVEDTLFATHDDGARKLQLGWLSLDGFHAPKPLVRCLFDGMPAAEEFVVTILDSTGTTGEPLVATVVPAVTPYP